MPRFSSLATFLVAALSILSGNTSLFAGTYGDLTYEVGGNGIIITDCNVNATGELSIPAEIPVGRSGNIPVTAIGDEAFRACSSLTSMTIPDNITSIGEMAFYTCSSLTSVTIPESVTSIGDYAFSQCYSLTSIDVDPANLYFSSVNGILFNKLQTTLIRHPGGITGSYTIPDSVTFIGTSAFSGSPNLTNVTIPDSVTFIGSTAFFAVESLTSVTFYGDAPSTGDPRKLFIYAADSFTIYFYEDAAYFTAPTWQGYPSEALSLTGDKDGDNWPNNLERLLGTSPVDGDSCFKTWLSQSETGLQIHHAPYSDACEFVVESTTDLSDPDSWQTVEGLSFSGDTTEQMAELSTEDQPAVFYRVSVNEIE